MSLFQQLKEEEKTKQKQEELNRQFQQINSRGKTKYGTKNYIKNNINALKEECASMSDVNLIMDSGSPEDVY